MMHDRAGRRYIATHVNPHVGKATMRRFHPKVRGKVAVKAERKQRRVAMDQLEHRFDKIEAQLTGLGLSTRRLEGFIKDLDDAADRRHRRLLNHLPVAFSGLIRIPWLGTLTVSLAVSRRG